APCGLGPHGLPPGDPSRRRRRGLGHGRGGAPGPHRERPERAPLVHRDRPRGCPAVLSGQKLGRGRIDYYLAYAGREGAGRWFGRGAAALGLTGSVRPDAFRALAAGAGPQGGSLLERVPADRVPGWDFTLSAPKSVSLSWAVADDDLRLAIRAAHEAAVRSALAFLEDRGGRARRGLGG